MPSTRACRRHEEAIPVTNDLVDLQHVDRQLKQVAERRVAGAEVVDRQLDADLPQLVEVGADPLVAAEQDGLGQLEQQRRRRQPGLVQRLPDAVDEPGSRNCRADTLTETCGPRRPPRRRPCRAAPLRPCRTVPAGAPTSPSGTMSPVSSASGDELAGQHHPPARVRPADQGLEAGDLAARRGHDRLVDERERGALDGVLERGLYLPPPEHARWSAPAGSAASAACPPPSPRTGPGPRGAAARPRRSLSAEVATPTVAVASTLASLSVNGSVNAATIRSANASTSRRPAASSMSSANSSPPSRAAVSDWRTDAGQPRGTVDQQLVADAVAHGVVDDLEVVQVDEEHARGPAGTARAASSASAASLARTAPGWAARSARRGRRGTSAPPQARAAR